MGAVNPFPGGTGMDGCRMIRFFRDVVVVSLNEPALYAGKLPSTGGFSKEPGQTCHFSNRCARRVSETVMICSFIGSEISSGVFTHKKYHLSE
jgi:hypothetical protein